MMGVGVRQFGILKLAVLVTGTAVLLSGCVHDSGGARPPLVAVYGLYLEAASTLPSASAGGENEINTVAWSLLTPGQQPQKIYGVSGYLLFPSRRAENLAQRRAAAAAFICHFESADAAELRGYLTERMAVFYAPVRSMDEAQLAIKDRDVDEFLGAAYDYRAAEWVARQYGLDLDGVYLVAYASPLTGGEKGAVEGRLVLDLSGKPPSRVRRVLLDLHDYFERQLGYQQSALMTVLKVFDSAGSLVSVLIGEAQAEEPVAGCL